MKICHITSAHPRSDTRIFVKQCQSLAQMGHQVTLVVADGKGDALASSIQILDVGRASSRLGRMVMTARRVISKAASLKADVYFLHDPELLPWVWRLRRNGKRVIFDSHEDVRVQLLSKPYLNPLLLKTLSTIYGGFETWICRRLDGVIAATPTIRDKFSAFQPLCIDINNFPSLREFPEPAPWSDKPLHACYVGGISRIRGIVELVQAMDRVQPSAQLVLAGGFESFALHEQAVQTPGWNRVVEKGILDRQGVAKVLADARVGLVTLHPTPNYLEALPVKMFEYMAAGIPVIASDFPLWKTIVQSAQCGWCVDPLDPTAIASAIDEALANPQASQAMGERGRAIVLSQYNWEAQADKLIRFLQSMPWWESVAQANPPARSSV